jgi:integrase
MIVPSSRLIQHRSLSEHGDAMLQPFSGHASLQSLEIYSRLSLAVAQEEYDQAIKKFPV